MRKPRIRRHLLTGLLVFFPIWLTWIVLKFVVGTLSTVTAPVVRPLFASLHGHVPWLGYEWLQTLVSVALTLLLLFLLGYLASQVIGRQAIDVFDRLVARIPLVQSVYGGAKKLLNVLQTKPGNAQRVVLIDFPNKGMQAIGLVTRVLRDPGSGRELAAVYVPTTPNPTSGYLELVPIENLTATDMSLDEAMSFIISGGAIVPERFDPAQPEPPASR
ncbi:MAG: DUF502 domain-containing protein [Xanthomonadales bacterium]|nr:DUF502 domain-containing protein [Xanthomonadales bacterium]